MKVWMIWYGGSSYAAPAYEDLEAFDSIGDAVRSFEVRADYDPYYPCVYSDTPENGGPEAWLFLKEKPVPGDMYPDRTLSFGPRGGVRMIDG